MSWCKLDSQFGDLVKSTNRSPCTRDCLHINTYIECSHSLTVCQILIFVTECSKAINWITMCILVHTGHCERKKKGDAEPQNLLTCTVCAALQHEQRCRVLYRCMIIILNTSEKIKKRGRLLLMGVAANAITIVLGGIHPCVYTLWWAFYYAYFKAIVFVLNKVHPVPVNMKPR